MNYFQLFDLTPSFSVNLLHISDVYQRLQKSVHPDRYSHASSQEQLLAVQKSAQINDAYQTLKNPIRRAEYLLTVRNVELPSEQASFGDTHFLMQQMELHEMLEDIPHQSNVEQSIEQAREQLETDYNSLLVSLEKQLTTELDDDNKLAAETVRKLKFYQKLLNDVERLEEKLLD